jgi:peroxiredoxin
VTCNAEAASVEAASQRWGDRVNFVGVAWTGSDSEFQAFIDKYSLSFPQISDDDAEVYGRFEIAAQPATVIVTPDGAIQTIFGAADEAFLDSLLTSLTA